MPKNKKWDEGEDLDDDLDNEMGGEDIFEKETIANFSSDDAEDEDLVDEGMKEDEISDDDEW